jgi:hypothetical protein
VTAPDPRVGEIEARVKNHAKSPGGIYGPGSDVAYLLAELRKRDKALARVDLACDAMDAGVSIRSGDPRTKSHAATAIRAAVRESLDGAL